VRVLPHGDTVTILRPGPPTQDEYGNDVPGEATEIPVAGCGLAPRDGNSTSGNENVQGRDQVVVGLSLFAPAGTDLRATDQVRVAGVLYQVDGQPGAFRSPFTGSAGPVVAALELVTG